MKKLREIVVYKRSGVVVVSREVIKQKGQGAIRSKRAIVTEVESSIKQGGGVYVYAPQQCL